MSKRLSQEYPLADLACYLKRKLTKLLLDTIQIHVVDDRSLERPFEVYPLDGLPRETTRRPLPPTRIEIVLGYHALHHDAHEMAQVHQRNSSNAEWSWKKYKRDNIMLMHRGGSVGKGTTGRLGGKNEILLAT
ncbi:hypothetical protein PV326_008852 [Microctonus aethiopoides]|nr:hypothetical protein PV326_008852 [Microctonus aethiopoides]